MSLNADFRVDWREHVAVFTLNAEHNLNALTKTMITGLECCLNEMPDRGANVLIITGSGQAFCSGTDLKEASDLSSEQASEKADQFRDLFFRIYRSPIISIAAINGLALGGGLELALACRFRVAERGVKMGLPEVKLAFLPCYGGTQFLPPLIGKSRAADLMLTGRSVGAEEGLAMGLVNRMSVDRESALDQSLKLASEISQYSQGAVSRILQCINQADNSVCSVGLDFEGAMSREQGNSADAREGLQSFLEKRKPKFIR